MPVTDPSTTSVGGTLQFRMRLFGRPLAEARGHASVAASAEANGANHETTFESDARGEFTVTIAAAAVWNVRAVYILPAPVGSGADWDAHWATFVWRAGRVD